MYKEDSASFAAASLGSKNNINSNEARQPNSSAPKTAGLQLENIISKLPDVVCLSHLRWDFVYQRPQHLLSRFARHKRLFFVEEPIFEDLTEPRLETSEREGNVLLVVPHLPHGLSQQHIEEIQRELLDSYFAQHNLQQSLFWYYTPMALAYTRQFNPILTVYDCMDELSAFKFAPERLKELEQELFRKADLVFTGGQSLYEVKKEQHPRVFAFPSSIDKAHFAQARQQQPQPEDQAQIPEPRIGFFGVIDERMNLELLADIADARPEWQLIMVGPIVKIDPRELPQRPNLHYLGGKSYQELPHYLSGWSVAMLPFAINESTRFISPTKTPEYLAAGKPVVSTPITDVVRPYGEQKLVHIANNAEAFVMAIDKALAQQDDQEWHAKVDHFLKNISWDQTWQEMVSLIGEALQQKQL